MTYAMVGINWEFLYKVIYEDDCILILKDLGRFHRFDTDRMWTAPIDKYIDITNDYVRVGNVLKLVEVQS